MIFKTLGKTLLLGILIFFTVKFILYIKFRITIEKKLGFIPSEDLKTINSLKFEWLPDSSNKEHTLESFRFPEEDNSISRNVTVASDDGSKFEVLLNENIVISRKCLNGYKFTDLGCSKNIDCMNKRKNEFVIDKLNKYTIHKCDGKNNILESHSCHPKNIANYNLPFSCGETNICYDKQDGYTFPNNNTQSYSYITCTNGIVVEKECNRFDEYFDQTRLKCVLAPIECRQLKGGDSIVLTDFTVCHKNSDGTLNVHFFHIEEDQGFKCSIVGNCNDKYSYSSNVLRPSLWTSSQFYKKCVNNFWKLQFCNSELINNNNQEERSQRTDINNKIHSYFPDGILYALPPLDHINVFDKKHQNCVPFDYKTHFKSKQIPLLYTDPFMIADSNVLPVIFYDFRENKPQLQVKSDFRLNDEYSSLLSKRASDNLLFNETDRSLCFKHYQKYTSENDLQWYLGVLTTLYSNIILSCRFGNPVNKLAVEKSQNPDWWGRKILKNNSYKLANGRVKKCNKNKTLHKFIPTCVDHRCSRADFLYPTNYRKNYPTLSVSYNDLYTFCSRSGTNMNLSENVPVKTSNLLKQLGKYCQNKKPGYWAHPYLNTPLNCDANKNKTNILNDRSYRDSTLKTLQVEEDSIFKKDMLSLHMYFLPGEDGN